MKSDDDQLAEFAFDQPGDSWLDHVKRAERPNPLSLLGRYELLEEVSRGGQGVVYRARLAGDSRCVAVKRLLRAAAADPTAHLRMERELQTAQSLDHPGIVAVLHFEFTAGQPLLAMEWIDGIAVTEWASLGGTRRGPEEIVTLMRRICDALQHAHQRGVIHRDLKPSNILVNALGQPFILDFGLAKFSPARLGLEADGRSAVVSADSPSLTLADQVVGTLAYASPEQLQGQSAFADVRSDIYSLGVILYEMLTGALPYPRNESPSAMVAAMETRAVPRPSSLNDKVDRDLSAIIFKAMEHDPARRYQSVDALDADLARYLAREPVLARGPGIGYELRKLIRRHRVAVMVSAIAVALITAGGITATLLAAHLASAQRQEQEARQREQDARQVAEAVNGFLNDMLASVDPRQAPHPDVTMRQVLDVAADRLANESMSNPLVQAGLHNTIGRAYHALGLYDDAERHLERGLSLHRDLQEPAALEMAENLSNLASLRFSQGQFEDAHDLSSEALKTFEEVHGPQHRRVAMEMNNLAVVLRGAGQPDEAEQLHRKALAMRRQLLGDDHLDVAESLNNLAAIMRQRGELAEAERLCREVLDIRRRHLGDDHLLVAQSINNVAAVVAQQGRVDETIEWFEQAIAIYRAKLDENHPDLATTLSSLGSLLVTANRFAEAEAPLREGLRIRERALAAGDVRIATTELALGICLLKLRQLEEAETLLVRSRDALTQTVGPDHPQTQNAVRALAQLAEMKTTGSSAP